jgi:DNA-binding transcriptional LysR family regulator
MAGADEPLSIRQIEAFVALIEQGSFTRAAKKLRLSQSTVSGHIADMERRLGVRLVERDRDGAKPTAAGRALLKPARDVLRAERNARMAIAEVTGLLRGSLVIGGSTIPASYLLPPLLGEFRRAHPGVSIRLVTGDSRAVAHMVRAGEIDLGVVGALPREPGLESWRVGEDRLILVVAKAHPLARRRRVAVGEVLHHPLVMREEGSGTREATLAALAKALGKRALDTLEIACEVGSAEAMKAAVRAGLGAAFVSDLSVREELERGTLVALEVKQFAVAREFHLVAREEEFSSPAARAMRDLAVARAS